MILNLKFLIIAYYSEEISQKIIGFMNRGVLECLPGSSRPFLLQQLAAVFGTNFGKRSTRESNGCTADWVHFMCRIIAKNVTSKAIDVIKKKRLLCHSSNISSLDLDVINYLFCLSLNGIIIDVFDFFLNVWSFGPLLH